MSSEGSRHQAVLRSLAHRLVGDGPVLPDEGALAPFDGATSWLNTDPLTPGSLRGRVVLVDFWTYTCVNWLRTLPYVRAWADKYRDAGLTVIGVHTPEFGFERDVANIAAATHRHDVGYPVAVDSAYRVWQAFGNHYWPAVYLADADGRVRFHHFGEGEYPMTEMAIQQLLVESGAEPIDMDLVTVEPMGLEVAADWANVRSPESYTGYGQASGFAQATSADFDRSGDYRLVPLRLNEWALDGRWTVTQHSARLDAPGGRLAFRFHARDLNLVMGPAELPATLPIHVTLDGQELAGSTGIDIRPDGSGVVEGQRTYQLIRQTGPIVERRFEIEFVDAGAEVYCFTFG